MLPGACRIRAQWGKPKCSLQHLKDDLDRLTFCCVVLAAEIKARYKLYYVDSVAAALALEHKASLVTSDSDFRRLGIAVPLLWLKS